MAFSATKEQFLKLQNDYTWKQVWIEDDCTKHDPYHEDTRKAFMRLYGLDWNWAKRLPGTLSVDQGDCILYFFQFDDKLIEILIASDADSISEGKRNA
jgi:hypothetical protein